MFKVLNEKQNFKRNVWIIYNWISISITSNLGRAFLKKNLSIYIFTTVYFYLKFLSIVNNKKINNLK